ncbi:hypothetical protein NC981_22215 [Leptolyngbya sp. DQ-M1]|uniref:hypothetical protein n=1 Tax=Leptolyngbya sp. DQ-M1 TaxID=2933920 RepID=UPI0032985BF9
MRCLLFLLSVPLASVLVATGFTNTAQASPSKSSNSPVQVSQWQQIPGGVQQIPGGVKLDPNRFSLAADLVLEKLDVQDLGGDRFQLTATLRNGRTTGTGQTYPGGGRLVIERTSGSTVLTSPNDAFVALPGGATTLASQPIPAIEYGQTITLTATTQGRAIFSASAVPDGYRPDVANPPLPEQNPNNNRKEVNTLIARKHPISSKTLSFLTSSFLSKVQIRLDRDNSYVKIPGLGERRWQLPEKQQSISIGFLKPKVSYYVHDINSENLEMSIDQGSLVLSLAFETNGDEIIVTDPVPDINAGSITAQIKLPLTYDSKLQYLSYGTPQINVNVANLSFKRFGFLLNSLLPDVNQSASESVQQLFNDPKLKRQLEYQINRQLREAFVKGGRIVNVSFSSDEILLEVESGAK